MKMKRTLLSIVAFIFTTGSLAADDEYLPGKMQPFRKIDDECNLHIEDYCFAKVCNGFI